MAARSLLGALACLVLFACENAEPSAQTPPAPGSQPQPQPQPRSDAQPKLDAQSKPDAPTQCDQTSLAELATKLDQAEPRERVNQLAEGLLASCGDQLVPTVAHYLEAHGKPWDEVGSGPPKDERFVALKQKVCPNHASLADKIGSVTAEERRTVAYDVCDYARFDLFTREEAGALAGMGWFTWTTHQMLLDQGTPADVAKTIGRAMMLLESANLAPQLFVPLKGQELPSADNTRPLRAGIPIYLSTTEAHVNEMQVASLEDGYFPRRERPNQAPYAVERLIPGILDALIDEAERGSTGLLLVLDRRLQCGAVVDTLYTGTKAGFTEFDLIVESPFPIKRALPVRYSAPWSDFDGLTVEIDSDGLWLLRSGSDKRESLLKKGEPSNIRWELIDSEKLLKSVEAWNKQHPDSRGLRVRCSDPIKVDIVIRIYSLLLEKDCEDDATCPLPAVTLERL